MAIPIKLDLNWLCGCEITLNERKVVIFNIYMPVDNTLNEDVFLDNFAVLTSIIEELYTSNFVIMGDWKANIFANSVSCFGNHLVQLCTDKDNCLSLSSKISLPHDSFTFTSHWNTVAWIGHVISSSDFHKCILSIYVH